MTLYLIRHPHTQPDPAVPASQWQLSDRGQAQVRALVDLPLWSGVIALYTSQEYKTTVVGEAVHAAHGLPFTPIHDLGEAQRDRWLDGEDFEAAQRAFFARPDVPPVPDWESAAAARQRFVAAMDGILRGHPAGESLAVVSHASVLTLYTAHLAGEAPSYERWPAIGFMAIMAVDRTTLRPLTAFLVAPYEGL
jgi:broad specificity phosphatase PhoE